MKERRHRTLNKREAIDYINNHPEYVMQPDNKGKGYICPLCNSGSGKKGTGLTEKNQHYTCWSCNGIANNSVTDIIAIKAGIDVKDINAILAEAKQHYSFNFDLDAEPVKKKPEPKKEPATDYTEFYKEANKNLAKTQYLLERGISTETANHFLIGYVEKWQNPKTLAEGKNPPATPRIIIPTSAYSYLARDTRQNVPEAQQGYEKQKVGKLSLFNLKGLQSHTEPIFIVEGEIDALSIIEAGAEAIALGSTSMYKNLLNHLQTNRPTQPLLLALDADSAGTRTQEELAKGLDALNIKYHDARSIYSEGKYKDANEALVKDKKGFIERIETVKQEAQRTEQNLLEEAYNQNSTDKFIDAFKEEIKASATRSTISTGFTNLDKALEGGLFAGLYVIGAVSSLGKTTFCLQMADNIAAENHDVLFFSLEMARSELIAKSASRLSFLQASNIDNASTTREILTGSKYKYYSEEKKKGIEEALNTYSTYAQNIFIEEAIDRITTEQIKAKVEEHYKARKKAPVVIVDYLQIIKGANERGTDKQNTDAAILDLKHISRDYNTPVIVISSFNRDNYDNTANMAAFKESGGIEYSTDIAIGLQLAGLDDIEGLKETEAKAKRKEIKDRALNNKVNPNANVQVEAKILKNRNGKTGSINFDFKPMFNVYTEERTLDF